MNDYIEATIDIRDFSDLQILKGVEYIIKSSPYRQDYKKIILALLDKEFGEYFLTNEEQDSIKEDIEELNEESYFSSFDVDIDSSMMEFDSPDSIFDEIDIVDNAVNICQTNEFYMNYIKENLELGETFDYNFTYYPNKEYAKQTLESIPNFENIKNFILNNYKL